MIATTYPRGWFVALADGQVVAASADFQQVERELREQGKDPREVLVVEAGVEGPEYVNIFI